MTAEPKNKPHKTDVLHDEAAFTGAEALCQAN
jgi:hypothetical protein